MRLKKENVHYTLLLSFVFFIQIDVFIVLTYSLDVWPKYASERLWNYLKKQVLEPKRAVLVPQSPNLK